MRRVLLLAGAVVILMVACKPMAGKTAICSNSQLQALPAVTAHNDFTHWMQGTRLQRRARAREECMKSAKSQGQWKMSASTLSAAQKQQH